MENLRLRHDDCGIHASSHLIQSLSGHSIAATYVLNCDPRWRFRRLWLQVDNHGRRSLTLDRDIRGHWFLNGEPRPDLLDCQQAMLSASPFTHTPALQHYALETGQKVELQVAWVDLFDFKVEVRRQRYHCLRRQAGRTVYSHEAEGRPASEMIVDDDALLIESSGQYLRQTARTLRAGRPA
ncbi:putative glycolipid-binding domain-containing protein [Zestomonas carbonaria]